MINNAPVVYALDIGVYRLGVHRQVLNSTTTGWCRTDTMPVAFMKTTHDGNQFQHEDGTSFRSGRDIEQLACLMANDLKQDRPVALGFEAPMWFPIYGEHRHSLSLFTPRFPEESGHEWYLQAGAAATLKAASLGCLLFSRLAAQDVLLEQVELSTDPGSQKTPGTLVLFEAFVAGEFKLDRPSGVLESAVNEWDAATAASSWFRVRTPCSDGLPGNPVILHKGGSIRDDVISVWNIIINTVVPSSRVHGPHDCEVVGTRNNLIRR